MYIWKYSKIFSKLIISSTAFTCSSWLYGLTWPGQWGNEERSSPQVQVQKSWDRVATTIALFQAQLLRYSWTKRQSYCIQMEKETELANLGRKSLCKGSSGHRHPEDILHTFCTHGQYPHPKSGKALPSLCASTGIWGFQFMAGYHLPSRTLF